MSLQVDDPLVERMARLAELQLSEEEREQAKQDMTDMISFLDRLDGAALEGVEPLYQVNPAENVFREDIIFVEKEFRENEISMEKKFRGNEISMGKEFRDNAISKEKEYRENTIFQGKEYRKEVSGTDATADISVELSPWLKQNAPDSEGRYFVVPRTLGDQSTGTENEQGLISEMDEKCLGT